MRTGTPLPNQIELQMSVQSGSSKSPPPTMSCWKFCSAPPSAGAGLKLPLVAPCAGSGWPPPGTGAAFGKGARLRLSDVCRASGVGIGASDRARS